VYAITEHNGDFSAAAKDLYEKGYGARIKKSSVPKVFQDVEINEFVGTEDDYIKELYAEIQLQKERKIIEDALRPDEYHDIYVNRTPQLPDSFYSELPAMMVEPLMGLKSSKKRDFCLLSLISAFSGIFAKNYEMHYGDDLMPFINAFVIAGSGKGKGTAERVVTRTFDSIVKVVEAKQKSILEEWYESKEEAKAAKKAFPFPKPLHYTPLMGGSMTKAGLMGNCKKEEGFSIFVSEADEISNSDHGQHGGFSSFIRSSYHEGRVKHKLKDEEINSKALFSICVTGTHDQLFPFFGKNGTRNGLTNRFAYYALPKSKGKYKFKTPRSNDGDTLSSNAVKAAAEDFKRMYLMFNPINSKTDTTSKKMCFEYSEDAINKNDLFWQNRFEEAMRDNPRMKEDMVTGIINRLSLMHARICAMVKFIECFENDKKFCKDKMISVENDCTGSDRIEIGMDIWDTVKELMLRIFYYSIQVHLWLEDDAAEAKPMKGAVRTNSMQNESLIFQSLPNNEFSTKQAYELISENDSIQISDKQLYRYM
jgi:hypothetical protein